MKQIRAAVFDVPYKFPITEKVLGTLSSPSRIFCVSIASFAAIGVACTILHNVAIPVLIGLGITYALCDFTLMGIDHDKKVMQRKFDHYQLWGDLSIFE